MVAGVKQGPCAEFFGGSESRDEVAQLFLGHSLPQALWPGAPSLSRFVRRLRFALCLHAGLQ